MLHRDQKLAIFMAGAVRERYGKMGLGVLRYSPNPVTCVIDPDHAGQDAADVTGIPRSAPIVATVDEALALGAEALVLGIAPPGGAIPEAWQAEIDRAWEIGMCLVNGLHDRLEPRYLTAQASAQWVWDIRVEPPGLSTNSGAARLLRAKRALLVGTDMSVGKMTAGLELWAEALKQQVRAEFVSTGQTGIAITGSGVPLDAVRVDFASGSIEREMLRYPDAELIIVEGQGSLVHPGSTATLPLMRGSVPTHLILCARAGQTHLVRLPEIAIPDLRALAKLNEDLAEACGAFPRPQTVAIALNCAHLGPEEAEAACAKIEAETGWPTADPVKHGAGRLLEALRPV